MTDQIRWGLLGAGGLAAAFTENLQTEGLHIQAVATLRLQDAQDFAGRFGIPTAHADFAGVLADPEVDAVFINTPHNFHAVNAIQAIEAGKPVMVVKPFTVTAAQARRVADAARANGVFCMEGMWSRFLPSTNFVREQIAEGKVGEVHTLITEHSQALDPDPAGRLHNPDMAGGVLLDLGVYNVSYALDLLGRPTEVIGRGTLGQTGVETDASILMVHEAAHSVGFTSMLNAGPCRGLIIGTEGYLEIDGPFYNWTTVTRYDGGRPAKVMERFEPNVTSRGMHFEALEVERCLRAGLTESPRMTLDATIEVMEVLDDLRHQVGSVLPEDSE